MSGSRRCSLFLVSWLVVLGTCCAGGFAAEVPEKVQEELERGKSRLQGEFKEAQEALLRAFDKKISGTRTAPKLTAEEKQQSIGSLEKEKAIFEKLGHIPFSATMRSESIEYLNKVQKGEIALGKIYSQAIDTQTKQKNDAAARALIEQKKQALEPKIVARWSVTFPKMNRTSTRTLWSNGSMQKDDRTHTWTLDQRRLVITWKHKEAPGGVFIDTGAISADGMQLEFTNQTGYKFSAKRLITE